MSLSTMHDLKCQPDPFWAIVNGHKTAEFRKNDRPEKFKQYDQLRLWEYEPDPLDEGGEKTGEMVRVEVTHVQEGFGIPDGYVMLSIRVIW